MTRRALIAAFLALSAGAFAAASVSAWLSGREEALWTREALAVDAARDAERVLAMRGMRERASLRPRPAQDLATRLGSALAALGLPRESLDRLTLDSDSPAGAAPPGGRGPAFRVQSMRVSLRRLRLADVGRLLARWRESEPLWTPTSIELARSESPRPAGGAGSAAKGTKQANAAGVAGAAEERYDVTLVLAAVYAADGGAPDRR